MPKARDAIVSALVVSLAAAAIGGCGPSLPTVYPVEGKVSLKDGTPIEFGYVILYPIVNKDEKTTLDVCQGTIQQGGYTIMTDVRQGAQLGSYRVSIQAAK